MNLIVSKNEFEASCRARLLEEGFRKEELIEDKLKEAIGQYAKIKSLGLNCSAVEIKNLQNSLRDNEDMKIIDVVAFISEINGNGVCKYKSNSGNHEYKKYYSITIGDSHSQVKCLPVLDPKLKEKIDKARTISKKWIMRGFFLPMPKKGNLYEVTFCILDLNEYSGTYRSYDFTESEINYAQNFIEENKENLRTVLLKNLRLYLGIKKLNDSVELKRCMEFTIIQALSSSEVESKNGRLHSCVFGPPSSGKNFICRAIELLNLEFREGQSGKMSIAGLLGSCSPKNGRYISEPGLIPLAQFGVLAIQDFHSLENCQKSNFFGVASKAMQDGKAIDSTSAKTIFLTLVAFHLDANKASDIKFKKEAEFDFDAEFGIPLHILTRFDFLMSMLPNHKFQFETSKEMLRKYKAECEIENPERILKLIIAILKERFPLITISDEVRSLAEEKLDNLYNDNKKSFDSKTEISIFQNRLSSSMIKILHSVARLNHRDHSLPEDVNYMISFLEPKISFLKHFDSSIQIASMLSQNEKKRKRQKFIIDNFLDESFSLKMVIDAMMKENDLVISQDVSERTVRRCMEDIVEPAKGKAMWKIKKVLSSS